MMSQASTPTENSLNLDSAPRPNHWLRRSIDFLGSGRLAIVLLTALILLLFLYLFIPQFGPGEEALRDQFVKQAGIMGELCRILSLTDIRHSWWIYGTFGLLFVNLLLCMIRRFRATVLLCRFPAEPPSILDHWPCREVSAVRLEAAEINRFFRKKGYRTLVSGDTVYGLRGRFAVVGHWVFHVSLLVLLAVGAFVAASSDPFRGRIGLGQGEAFDLHHAPFLSTNAPRSPELPGLRFQLDGIDVVTEGESVRKFEAHLSTMEGEHSAVGINRPYRQRPYQVMVTGFGFMPGWVIVDEQGRMIQGAWVKLVPFPLEGEESFPIGLDPSKTSKVHVRFYPDYQPPDSQAEKDGDENRSYELRNPRFRTRIELQGEQTYEGLLEPDQRVPLGGGREFFFLPEIRRYVLLDVIREREYGFVFAGLGIMIFGLALRYVRIRKEILVQVGSGSLKIFGRSEFMESLFEEELDGLARDLANESHRPARRRVSP